MEVMKDYSSLSEQRIFHRENMEQASYGSQNVERIQKSPRVLLVDEVDIIFSGDVFGHAIMRPLVLKGKAISDALLYIWHQCTSLSSHSVLQCEQVKNIRGEYPSDTHPLIKSRMQSALEAAKRIKKEEVSDYAITDDKIQWKYFDGLTIWGGFNTTFAYIKEHQNKKIDKTTMMNNLKISISIGCFVLCRISFPFRSDFGCDWYRTIFARKATRNS
jgi:hypothetical protein